MNKHLVAVCVYLAALVQGLCVVSFPASASVLKSVLSDAEYGAIFVPQMFATIAGSLLASKLGPRATGGRTLGLAMLAAALAQLLLAAAASGGGFMAAACATFALGFGFGLCAAALNAWPGQLFPDRAETALVALHTVLASGFAFGPALASSTSAAGLWLALPISLSLLAFACAALAARFVPSSTLTAAMSSRPAHASQREAVGDGPSLATEHAVGARSDAASCEDAASGRAYSAGSRRDAGVGSRSVAADSGANAQGARAAAAGGESSAGYAADSSKRAAFLTIALLYALAEGTFANWAVVYLREERALSETWASLALTTFWSALAFGRLAASALLLRLPAVTLWRALPLAMTFAFLALPFVHTGPAALLGFAFAGLACSAFFPLTVSLGAQHFAGGAARASSLLTAALMVGVGVGSFVIGPLRGAASLSALYQVSAVYPLLALGLCVWVTTALKRLGQPGVADV